MSDDKHPIEAPLLDLREIAREHHSCTFIRLDTPYFSQHQPKLWIVSNMVDFREHDRRLGGGHTIYSYLVSGVTDYEHDSGYAFSFPVVGLQFVSCRYGRIEFEAWIKTGLEVDESDFCVPTPDYAPLEDPEMCEDCSEPHLFAPYLPDHNAQLYEKVKGCRVVIETGLDPARVSV